MKIDKHKKLDDLKQQGNFLLAKAQEIEDEIRDEEFRPVLRKLVGKTFVYQNAGGGSIDGRWPLYAKIIGFDEKKMSFTAVQFQKWCTSYSKHLEIEIERVYNFNGKSHFGVDSNWELIPESEYNKARSEMFRFIQNSFSK